LDEELRQEKSKILLCSLLKALVVNSSSFHDFQVWFRFFPRIFDVREVTTQLVETSKRNTTCTRLVLELGNFILNTKIIDEMCLRNKIWKKMKLLYLFVYAHLLPADCISHIILTYLEFLKDNRLKNTFVHQTYETLSGTYMNVPFSFSKLGPENRSW